MPSLLHMRIVRLTVALSVVNVAIGVGIVLPCVLVLWVSWSWHTWTERAALGLFVGVAALPLTVAIRVSRAALAHVRRWDSYPDEHWRRAGEALWWSLAFELIGAAVAAAMTGFAVYARTPLAPRLMGVICCGDVIVFLGYLLCLSGLSCTLCRGQVVPYFEHCVGEIDTFCHGQSLLRNLAELDRIAREVLVAPLSDFGWGDDMLGQNVVWHEPTAGLKTVKSLLAQLQSEDLARPNAAGIIDDLERIAHALERAAAEGCRFSLLLRYSDATNGQEWDIRQGTCF